MNLHHLALRTPDPAALAAFYRDILHLPVVRSQPHSIWLGLETAVLMIERAEPTEPPVSIGEMSLIAFQADRPEQAAIRARLTEQGIATEGETAWTFYFRDPEGRRLGVSCYSFTPPG